MQTTTRQGLQERQGTPLALPSSLESLNSIGSKTSRDHASHHMPLSHSRSGYNSENRASMSGRVFVLSKENQPLTPCKVGKARKLLEGNQAKPVWNKFNQFGIQMLVETRKETPKTVLGIDFGTKYEGYTVVCGKENNLSVMWKLPDKKKLVKKLEERMQLRMARRRRNCRRREARFNNRGKDGFIAPSQKVIVQSRLKAMQEFFNYYPITAVALEDVCFNHRDNRWGKNFSTIEMGKKIIRDFLRKKGDLFQFRGYDTQDFREQYGYKKSHSKNAEVFNAHCSDALALAASISTKQHISPGKFIVVDDTYRPVRRRLHDTQPTKGGIRERYSTGNFKGIRKGTMCNFGKVCGGIKEKIIRTYGLDNYRLSKNYSDITWLSHSFKTNEVMSQLTTAVEMQCPITT